MPSTVSKSKIVIAGGTGFLGQLLAKSFIDDGYEVILLTRGGSSNSTLGKAVFWDAKKVCSWTNELEGASVLINLTGKSIDCRHTSSNRREILDSRVYSTRVLGEALHACKDPPPVWLNASSMALYGQCLGDEPAHDENAKTKADGFLEEVTIAWEKEFFNFEKADVRQIALRISFILGRSKGAFPLLKGLANFGLGGAQGSGDQWMSWLHQDDWVGIIRFLCQQNNIHGPINLSSPNPCSNAQFMKTLRKLVAPFGIGLPAPAWGVKIGCALLGSAPELALQSRRVISYILSELNFDFKYAKLSDALENLTNK